MVEVLSLNNACDRLNRKVLVECSLLSCLSYLEKRLLNWWIKSDSEITMSFSLYWKKSRGTKAIEKPN